MTDTSRKDYRKFDRIETNVRVKLQGDTVWTECADANVSGCGLAFDATKKLGVGNFDAMQIMLRPTCGTCANMLFFATAKVLRTVPRKNLFRTAVELIIDDSVRSEILRVLHIINSQNLQINRPKSVDVLFGRAEQNNTAG